MSGSLLATTGRAEGDLVGSTMREAFPENPESSEIGAGKEFVDSVQRVLATGRPHRLNSLRYDIEDPSRPGEFLRKRWTVTTAALRDGDVVGAMVQFEDVSLVDDDLITALRAQRDVLSGTRPWPEGMVKNVEAVFALIERYAELAEEVEHLRYALRSRPIIEQAKGIIMADRRCGPEQAFLLLRRLSNDTNVRLADVAAAVVYQRSRPPS